METTRIEVPWTAPSEQREYGGADSFNVAVDHEARVVVYTLVEDGDLMQPPVYHFDQQAILGVVNHPMQIEQPDTYGYYAAWIDETGEIGTRHAAGTYVEGARDKARHLAAVLFGQSPQTGFLALCRPPAFESGRCGAAGDPG